MRSIYHLAKHKTFMVYDRGSLDPLPMPVPDIPVDLLKPVLNYLGEVPGYNIDLPYNEQTTDKPVEQYRLRPDVFHPGVHAALGRPRPHLPGRAGRHRHARHRA